MAARSPSTGLPFANCPTSSNVQYTKSSGDAMAPAAASPSARASTGGRSWRMLSTHTALVSSRIAVNRCACASASSNASRVSGDSDARTLFSSFARLAAAFFTCARGDSPDVSHIIDRTCEMTNVGSSPQSATVGSASPCTRKP